MVAPSSRKKSVPAWHAVFLAMLPAIRQHARIAFRHLKGDDRDEAIQEVICNACQATARLAQRGKLDLAYPMVLARYAVAQVNDGRKVGCKMNVHDISSTYCQLRKKVKIERLDHFDEEDEAWKEAVVQDTRSAPVPEIVSFRLDFADWLRSLSRQKRRIAQFLSVGNRTSDAASKFNLSSGRISQLRSELAESWQRFIEEPIAA